MSKAQPFHLPDLYIKGFRGINELSIPRLGRVTLLAGKNGVGKTTVLDAVRVYAARGSHTALRELLLEREEVFFDVIEDERITIPEVSALFYGRRDSLSNCITIGSTNTDDQLRIDMASPDEIWEDFPPKKQGLYPEFWDSDSVRAVKVEFRSANQIIPLGIPLVGRTLTWRLSNVPEVKCEYLRPSVLTNRELVWFWDNVALTDDANLAIDSLNLMLGNGAGSDAVVGVHAPEAGQSGRQISGRQIMVRLKSHHRPVPLRSLGDGAMRMFGVALALANSRDGFLLIDEVENGLHYSVQRDFWRMILRTAQANNVQVLATTHSWDCVTGFARAAVECEEAEGILHRLSRQYGDLRAVEYPEDELKIAADQHIEVR